MVKPLSLGLLALLAAGGWAKAAVWPETFGAAKRVSVKAVDPPDRKLWSEYGLQEAEQAEYDSGAGTFTALGYRFQDSTGAMAAFEWQRPKDAKPSQLGKLAVETPSGAILAHGNYLFFFQRYKPQVPQLESLFQSLPNLDQSPLPALRGYLPSDGLVPNSERYIVGPAGLEAFDPGIPPADAAFHLGAEAQVGSFRHGGSEMKLAIFSYPTPNLARERFAAMQKLPGAVAKRTGPLVAVILSAPDPNDAEWLLSLVRYQATISWDERVTTRKDNIGDLIINIFILIGVLLAFSAVAGLAFGGLRLLTHRGRKGQSEAMTVLHLGDR